MYRIHSHTGQEIEIPATVDEDQPYFLTMDDEAEAYYRQHGYVVLRGLLPHEVTAAARQSWANQIKSFDGLLYRQTTSRPEKNKFNEQGYVVNPVLNVQSVRERDFAEFRRATLDCLTYKSLREAVSVLLGDDLKIVQSMYFEGNTSTPPHQDTFYLDSENIGEMCAAWLALEPIEPNAGRFFVCPGSHKIDIKVHGGDFDIAGDSNRYQRVVLDLLRKLELKVVAPALAEGDVLIWNSKTIHGSLGSPGATASRQSLTAHFIPRRSRFLQLQSRIKPLDFINVAGVQVARIKSQDNAINRTILWTEARLPFLFYPIKAFAIRQMARRS